jgi:hypothetical protein
VNGPGDRFARTWVRLYTRGLPDELAERRRDELASDLFEHASLAPSPAQQREVIGRVLWGIPADLSWRRAARASRERRLATGAAMTIRKVSTIVFVVYVLFFTWGAIGIIGNGYGLWAMPLLVGSALIVVGLRQRDEAPRRSTVLLVAGAFFPVPTLFWMAVIFGPVWLLVSWLAIASEPGRRPPTPAPAI